MDRDADPPGHDALLAVAEAEPLDERCRYAPLGEVRVRRVELQLEPQRLVWLRLECLAGSPSLPAPGVRRRLRGAGRAFLCRRGTRPALGLPSALALACRLERDAADPGERDRRLADRDDIPAAHLHAVNEVEHVALDAAAGAETVEDLLLEVDRAGGLRVVMEGAADLALHSPARREAVVGEDGAEVRACLDRVEVNTNVGTHLLLHCK